MVPKKFANTFTVIASFVSTQFCGNRVKALTSTINTICSSSNKAIKPFFVSKKCYKLHLFYFLLRCWK